MKKIAITLSAATLILGGLVGCGNDNQGTTGQGGVNQRGFGYHATEQQQDTGFTGQRAGEGPITDMFTRDDRRGATGLGRDVRQPATGFAGDRTGTGHGTGLGANRGATDQGTGLFGANRGTTGQGTGLFGGNRGTTGQGTGLFGGNRGTTGHGTGTTGQGTGMGAGTGGVGLGADVGRRGTTGHGTAASPGWQGETGYTGGTRGLGAGLGMRGNTGLGTGDHGGMTGTGRGQAFGAGDQRGAGIVGNRPGYVDDRGILRERAGNRAGIGGLGRNQATPRTGIYGTPDTTGTTGTHGLGRHGANGRAGDRVVPGTGMSEFAYPDGYDAATVRNYTTRLSDVENVNDSRVILHGNRVLVGVDADRQNAQRVEQDIRQRLRGMTGDREVIVVTERDRYDQIRTADDRLRAGEPFEEVGATINDMFHDFGRAIQRPFERSR